MAKGALSFNRFWYRENAIEAALAIGDAALARSHADALLGESELPPWARTIGERGLLLARVAHGERGGSIVAELTALITMAGGDLTAYPNVARWLGAVTSRPSWGPASVAFDGLAAHLAQSGAKLVTVRG